MRETERQREKVSKREKIERENERKELKMTKTERSEIEAR